MANYGTDEYKQEHQEARKRISKNVTISGVTFCRDESETKLTIEIGGKKVTWDYYDWMAFEEDIRYQVQPKKLEEAIMDTIAGKDKS